MTTATTLICAHRGASAQLPDNSLAAFEAAIALGADMIEADVRLNGNTLVLSHDPALSGSSLGVSTMEGVLSRSPCERLSFTAIVRQPILERGKRLVNPPAQ